MQNITFRVEKELIEAARQRALSEQSTLEQEFARWIQSYAEPAIVAARAIECVARIRASGVSSGGRKFTREEMNERGIA